MGAGGYGANALGYAYRVFVISRGSESKQQRLLRDYPGSMMRQ